MISLQLSCEGYYSPYFPVEEAKVQRTFLQNHSAVDWQWLEPVLPSMVAPSSSPPQRPAAPPSSSSLPSRLLTVGQPKWALPCSGLPTPEKALWHIRVCELKSHWPGFKTQLTTYRNYLIFFRLNILIYKYLLILHNGLFFFFSEVGF